jgi:hypothetical protein
MKMKNRKDWRPARALAFAIVFASLRAAAYAQHAPGTITTVAGFDEGCSSLATDPNGNLYVTNIHGIQKLATETGKFATVSPEQGWGFSA